MKPDQETFGFIVACAIVALVLFVLGLACVKLILCG